MGPTVRSVVFVSVVLFTSCTCARPARASGPDETAFDAATLADMESHAAIAEPRERCYLAGRDMAAGDEPAAGTAMQHADADAARLKEAISRDSKKLKNAEQLMEHSVHRLSDMLRVATMDQRDSTAACSM